MTPRAAYTEVQGDTPEARARWECEQQGIPFALSGEQMAKIARIIERSIDARERSEALAERGAA